MATVLSTTDQTIAVEFSLAEAGYIKAALGMIVAPAGPAPEAAAVFDKLWQLFHDNMIPTVGDGHLFTTALRLAQDR
jgi:hypothetical protein